ILLTSIRWDNSKLHIHFKPTITRITKKERKTRLYFQLDFFLGVERNMLWQLARKTKQIAPNTPMLPRITATVPVKEFNKSFVSFGDWSVTVITVREEDLEIVVLVEFRFVNV